MKVLFVVGGLPFGGIETWLFDVAAELSRRKLDFRIVNLSGTGEKLSEFIEAGFPVVNLGNSKADIKTFKLKTVRKLRDLIKKYEPSIIHSAQFTGDYFSRLAALKIRNCKVVTHIRNTKIEKRLERRIFNRLLSFKTDVFLSVSKAVYEMVEKEYNLAKKPHYVLYNAINKKRLINYPINLSNSYKYIICVGRLVSQKKFDAAIKAFALIEKDFPNVRLLIVGDGKERENLQKIVQDLTLTDKVVFTGYQKNVFPFLKAIHIFLFPSSYEGFGTVLLEAMYAGLPSIVSPYVPSLEIASEACIVAPIEPEKIAKAIKRLLLDEKLYSKFSRKAKEIAQQFTIEKHVDKLLTLYEGLLTNNLPKEKML